MTSLHVENRYRAVRLHKACADLLAPLTHSTHSLASQKWTDETLAVVVVNFSATLRALPRHLQ